KLLNLRIANVALKCCSNWPSPAKERLGFIKSYSFKQQYLWRKEKSYFVVAQMEEFGQNNAQMLHKNLNGSRNAIITGVSKLFGIGRSLVNNFLEQGYRVVGIDSKDLEYETVEAQREFQIIPASKLPADRFRFVRADISDPLKAKLAVKEAVEWLDDCIHVLINNAAKTITSLDEKNPMTVFAETVAVNLNGSYYMSECVLPYMPPGLSSIINISSTRALQSEPNTAAYSASKAGLCGLTHSQAITLAGRVRVNAVLPGWINTDPAGEAALRAEDHNWHPVGRVGTPQDIAELCLFLSDEKRSGFITGQEFVVDGGVTKKM
ncbi:hypothetical protein KI387_000481, partial [Taxus chinensis]